MKLAALRAFIARAVDEEYGCHTCVYGHSRCSDRPFGRCSDELWQQPCSDESDDDYQERMEDNQ